MKLEEFISAEAVFKNANCSEIFGDIEILAARMIDKLRVDNQSKVLCVGPGLIYSHPLACEIKGAKVDIVQPKIYNGIPQNELLSEYLEKARERIPERYRKRSIIIHEGLVEDINFPGRYYNYVCWLNGLDDDSLNKKQKLKMIDKILSLVQDKSTILLSACISQYDDKLDFLQEQSARHEDYEFRIERRLNRLMRASEERVGQEIELLRNIAKKQGFRSRIRRKFPGEEEVYELRLRFNK